ncbi:hypothetical protein D9M72_490590 [compost metagenome]
MTATMRLTFMPSMNVLSCGSISYHFSVSPSGGKDKYWLEAKETTQTISRGARRNRYSRNTSSPKAGLAGLKRGLNIRTSLTVSLRSF